MSKALPSTAWSLLHPCHVTRHDDPGLWGIQKETSSCCVYCRRPDSQSDSQSLTTMPGQPRITIPFTASHQDPPVAEQRRLWQGTRKMAGPWWARVPQMDPDTQTSCGLHWKKTPRSQALPQSYTKVQAVFGWLSSFTLMETWITVNRSYLGKLSYVTNLK